MPALNVGTFIRKLINKKGVSSGLSSMKCFSEGLGRRKFSGVREVNREVRKKREGLLQNIIYKRKTLEEEPADEDSLKIPIKQLQYVALLGIPMPTNIEKHS